MKYGYRVKANGVWYEPNTEIPEPVKKSAETVEKAVEEAEKAVEKTEDTESSDKAEATKKAKKA